MKFINIYNNKVLPKIIIRKILSEKILACSLVLLFYLSRFVFSYTFIHICKRFTAIKLPNLNSKFSDGTVYIYMDARKQKWTFLDGITTEDSAVGYTVAQMYASTESYNNVMF